jgi:hypothetical protein
MTHRSRILAVILFALAVAPVLADGTILTTGATLTVGTGNTQGEIIIDPAATGGPPPTLPDLGTLGSIGSMTGSVPPFPGGGTGADGSFLAMSSMTLPGGTYNFTDYTIEAFNTVRYTGAVEILVTGDVEILGTLSTNSLGASITIRCGGDFLVSGGDEVTGEVRAEADSSDVEIHAQGTLWGRRIATVYAADGTVSLTSNESTDIGVDLSETEVRGNAGVTIRSATGVLFEDGSDVQTTSGPVLIQAFGDDVDFRFGSQANGGANHLTVEAKANLVLREASTLNTSSGNLTATAFEGMLSVRNDSTINTSSGSSTLRAGLSVEVVDMSTLNTFDGPMEVTAYAGGVLCGDGPADDCTVNSRDGKITIRAATSITIRGVTSVNTLSSDIEFRAHGGDAKIQDDADVNSSDGHFDARASNGILALDLSGITPARVSLSAGSGGVTLTGNEVRANDGSLNVLTTGPITAVTSLYGASISLVSLESSVDISGADVESYPTEAIEVDTDSGDIVVESWAGSSGVIDATNATLRTGDASLVSGSIILRIYDVGSTTVVEAFFLPKRVAAKENAKKPEKSKLAAVGFFDLGPGAVDLTGAATLDVGGKRFDIPSFEAIKGGAAYRYSSGGVDFQVVPSRSGSSRAKFKLKYAGTFAGMVDLDGNFPLRFANAAVDGGSVIGLTRGVYKLGRRRGAISEPNLYVARAKAKVKGAGKDALKLIAGIATTGVTPTQAPELRIAFGPMLDVTIPSGDFTKSGDRFTFRGDRDGITSVVVDYLKEVVTVKGKNLDLGNIPEGAQSVSITLVLGSDERTVNVRMVRSRSSLKY